MPDFPVMLKLQGRRCVVIGGGATAVRRAEALLRTAATVIMIAPEICRRVTGVTVEQRAYRQGDLAGASLVIAATNDPEVNRQIAEDAATAGVLVNRVDCPQKGDFSVPAHAYHGPVTIAVDTGGSSASAAKTIRGQLSLALAPDWPILLQAVATYRKLIQHRFRDNTALRQQKLRALTNQQAMTILKRDGIAALKNHVTRIVEISP